MAPQEAETASWLNSPSPSPPTSLLPLSSLDIMIVTDKRLQGTETINKYQSKAEPSALSDIGNTEIQEDDGAPFEPSVTIYIALFVAPFGFLNYY